MPDDIDDGLSYNNLTPTEIGNLSYSEIQGILQTELKKLTKNHTIQDILRETPSRYDSSDSDDEEYRETPYYRLLDKSNVTRYGSVVKSDSFTNLNEAKSKKEINEILKRPRPVENDDDRSYRELLEWDVVPQDQRRPAYDFKPRKEPVSELCEILAKTPMKKQPEFLATPPRDIAEKHDVIMYPKPFRSLKRHRTEPETNSSQISYQKLTTTQNCIMMRMHEKNILPTTRPACPNQDPPEDENRPLIVSSKISEIRKNMANFTKTLTEFSEKTKSLREQLEQRRSEVFKVDNSDDCKQLRSKSCPDNSLERVNEEEECTEKEKRYYEEKDVDSRSSGQQSEEQLHVKKDGIEYVDLCITLVSPGRQEKDLKNSKKLKKIREKDRSILKRIFNVDEDKRRCNNVMKTTNVQEKFTLKRTIRYTLEMQMAKESK